MTGRARNPRGQGDRLRYDLIAAARRIVEGADTADALSIRAVAKEAGVAATSVYLHFRDREEIFRAAVADDYRSLAEAMANARDRAGPDPVARLKAIGRAYCGFASERRGSYRLITEVVQPVPDGGPRPEGHPAEASQAVMRDAISEAQNAGYAPDVDPELLLTCLWIGWHGFAQLSWAKPQREWPRSEEVVEYLVESLLGTASDGNRPAARQRVRRRPTPPAARR